MLLLEPDLYERSRLLRALRRAGLPVQAVASLAEMDRWPVGSIVITDAARVTKWWKMVGVAHVVVLASSADQGIAACQQGADIWVPRDPTDRLVTVLQRITRHEPGAFKDAG